MSNPKCRQFRIELLTLEDCNSRRSQTNSSPAAREKNRPTPPARETTTGLSSLPPGSIAAAVVEHETPIAPSASSRRRFVCSGVWCHQPPRDKTFSSDACVQLGTDRSTALFSRVRPPAVPRPTGRETTTGLSSLPPGSIAAAVVEHETPIAPSASSRRRFVCSGVWCHQPPRDKTFSSDACVQLGTDRSTALFSRVRPPFARLHARPPPACPAYPRGQLRPLLSSMRPRLHLLLLHDEDLSAPACGVTNRRGIRPSHQMLASN